MSERLRGLLAGLITLGLATVVLVGLLLADSPPQDRVDALAARLRCPTCQSESVADSPSPTARAMERLIAEQVAAGRSDEEILAYFTARYGEWVLLDPPPRGRNLVLWALPGLALIGGLVLMAAWKRGAPQQVSAGPPPTGPSVPEGPGARSRRRALAGAVAVVGACALVALLAVRAVGPRPPGGFVTGNLAEAAPGRDLASVTNQEMEAVLADNPEVVGMRLALADRYFQAGEFSDALRHYLQVLDRQPDHPEALARIGWMAYLSGEPPTAARYLERALAGAPRYAEALWYLANVRLDGLDDPAGAIPLLERLLALPDLPADARALVAGRLEEAAAR